MKDLGSSEIYPQTLAHSSNGRFVVACGDGEYIVYTAMALRNKDFGQGLEFVWAVDPNMFAVRESATNVKIKKNFKDHKSIRSDMVLEGISGGPLLALRLELHVYISLITKFLQIDELFVLLRLGNCSSRSSYRNHFEKHLLE